MDQARRDCLVPSCMVPGCPVCGGNMAMHLRCDQYFVEDDNWHEAAGRYRDFLKKMEHKKDRMKLLSRRVLGTGRSASVATWQRSYLI